MKRVHPDAGDLDALRLVTGWMREPDPFMYLRFADGEFYSMMGTNSTLNADGMPYYPETLGVELKNMLRQIQAGAVKGKKALIGGDWSNQSQEAFLREKDFLRDIPWGPVAIWSNGVVSGELANFFEAMQKDQRHRIFIGNEKLSMAATFLSAWFIPVPSSNAWAAKGKVSLALRNAPKNAVIFYCAGMATEAFAWAAYKERPDLSHLDMGHIFDGAAGIRSRSWMEKSSGRSERRDIYFDQYVPVFQGKSSFFGTFK